MNISVRELYTRYDVNSKGLKTYGATFRLVVPKGCAARYAAKFWMLYYCR
jgi:hypothetical protein